MKFEYLKDSTLKCKTDILTVEEVQELSKRKFIERVPVIIHCHDIHQQALIPFLSFISDLRCHTITIYVEKLDYQTARTICHFARQNKHALKMHLDLGEKILGFFSANELSEDEARDINDHLISGIYKKLHTLIIQYHTMKFIDASNLRNALLKAPLQSLEIRLNALEAQTKEYLKGQLTSWIFIPETHLMIAGEEQIPQRSTSSASTSSHVPLGARSIPADKEDLSSDTELNCLQKALTWMWSMVGRQNPSTSAEDNIHPTNHHRLN